MKVTIEKHKSLVGRYRAEEIKRRFNNVKYITAGNKKIALVSTRPIIIDITYVEIHSDRKIPIHKQHMNLMMGKTPKMKETISQTHRAFKITEQCITDHLYEIYNIVGIQ